ncbi:MAG TPA: hypothetical protein PK453_12895 [Leptospiraceae bacterium]|nr:hypothetical protein [Leptospiraceae bacterium]HMY65753.1 hypothetical protein [Leptospiraceae bacterium]HNF14562.1 hypothetical protein [Leptospiraceae bacterium]HNF25155.1 hypothetical protein [Leptospiraceae bacterium]HNH08235.1 hypothetical protein [Leptospiraceae bacterium]
MKPLSESFRTYIGKIYPFILFIFPFFSPVSEKAVKTSGIEFVEIPSGEFIFDHSYYYKFQNGLKCPVQDEKCRIKIKITGFSISRNPVSRKQWESVLGNVRFSPWEKMDLPACPECAAAGFSHDDTVDFLKALSLKDTGREDAYRLPTESEMIYLLGSCAGKCGEIRNTGTQFQFNTEVAYKNRFGFTVRPELSDSYIWTDDFASDSYLQDILLAGENPPYSDPRPKPSARFDYGRTLLSFSFTPDLFQIMRTGYSRSMVPSGKETLMYIVRKGKRK